ncbi:MAG: 3-oxoacyl-[acyl-carrier-protein] reductase [Proteobacteria bacterium]|nr:3-oxoacyl-[acyl-carrier-protein] reductase [Pseudomonadota bacterium]
MPDQVERTVVVTGGSRGIGKAVCLAFADPHTSIWFNYSSDVSAAVETEKILREKGARAHGVKVDVRSEDQVKAFFKTLVAEYGRLDVLVNNAGITRDNLLVRMKEADWDGVMDINLKGAFLCSKVAARTMIQQHSGRIINITSLVGVTGNAGQSNYVAAKAGLIGLTKALARELAQRNITVNAVAPGFIDTGMTGILDETAREHILSQIPLGRAGSAAEVAGVVEFLASDKAAYMTGQVIHVSGGMYI